jgi:hypothetical protein
VAPGEPFRDVIPGRALACATRSDGHGVTATLARTDSTSDDGLIGIRRAWTSGHIASRVADSCSRDRAPQHPASAKVGWDRADRSRVLEIMISSHVRLSAPAPCRCRSRFGQPGMNDNIGRTLRARSFCITPCSRSSASVRPLDIRQLPRPIEIGLQRSVEPEISEPGLARDRRNPVLFEAGRCRRSGVDVDRAIRVLE